MTTYTTDKGGASTDADVYIVLYGSDMATSQKPLCSSKAERKSSFKKGAMDKFVIEVINLSICNVKNIHWFGALYDKHVDQDVDHVDQK